MRSVTAGGRRAAIAGAVTCAALAVGIEVGRPANTSPSRGIGNGLVGSPAHLGDPHNAVVAVATRRPLIALSFDDGPSPRWTPEVLAALRANGAHATFFDIGTAATRFPDLVRAQLAMGDEVADHSWSHPRLRSLSPARLRREIVRADRALTAIGGHRPTLFRPPHGDFDRRVSAAVASAGLRLVGWDLALERELDGRGPAAAARAVARLARPGSIILAHDGGLRRGRSVAAIRLLLPALRRRGLRVVTVSTLLAALGPAPALRAQRRAAPDEEVVRRRALRAGPG